MVSKFASLSLQPEDIVFCFYGMRCIERVCMRQQLTVPTPDVRERDGGIADITLQEQVEEAFSKVLKMLSF